MHFSAEDEQDILNQSGSSQGMRTCLRFGRRRTLSISSDILEIHEIDSSPRDNLINDENGDREDDSSASDWDSWSEEENEQENVVLKTAFKDFFRNLTALYGKGETFHYTKICFQNYF